MGQVDVVDLSWVMGWRGLTCFLGGISGGRQRQIQGSFASLQDDDVKQTTARQRQLRRQRRGRDNCEGNGEAKANAGLSIGLLTKCSEQLRSG
jgi:hypothetical protein